MNQNNSLDVPSEISVLVQFLLQPVARLSSLSNFLSKSNISRMCEL